MQNILLFILFFIAGYASFFGYSFLTQNKTTPIVKTQKQKEFEFSIANAPKNSLSGVITSMSGQVKWESRTAKEPTVLKIPVDIHQGETVVTEEKAKASIRFDQYGTVDLNEKTQLDIVQTLPVTFVFAEKSGEVTYDVIGSTSFSVRSLHLLTMISKGSASIKIDSDMGFVDVSVATGEVRVGYNDLDKQDSFTIHSRRQNIYF